jgi:predicted nucleotidyltransferase component of viral defense system
MDAAYVQTVRLLLETGPLLFSSPEFVMKGGTAINLFVEDMPRLSVDIDVVWKDHITPRERVIAGISEALQTTRQGLEQKGIKARMHASNTGEETKLFVERENRQVKIEVNHVFRGTVLPPEERRLVKKARDLFTTDLSVPVLAMQELYGSKIVAALDRQHPRDFFDLLGMYEKDRLTPEILECFVSYLAGHNRPVHEVLFSRDKDIISVFQNEFVGMTIEPVQVDALLAVRQRLRKDLLTKLTDAQRDFLLSLVQSEPNWSLMPYRHLSELPAIRWKLQNLDKLKKMNRRKFTLQAQELRNRFEQDRAN